MANLKAQGLYDVADPDHDPENGDTYEKELFKRKQSFVYSVLVTSLQTEKGRELVKEFEGDARSIILKLHHWIAPRIFHLHYITFALHYICI